MTTQDLIGLLIETLFVGIPAFISFVPLFIPSTVKMITRMSFSQSRATHFLRIAGKMIALGGLAMPLFFLLFYLYTPEWSLGGSVILPAMIQTMFLVLFVYLASGIFVYEKAISCFEKDCVEIMERIDSLSVKVDPGSVPDEEQSSIRKGIRSEIQYLTSQLLEKRSTIAKLRYELNQAYPSRKSSKLKKLVLLLLPSGELVLLSALFSFPPLQRPTAVVGAAIIGILIGSFLLFVIARERTCPRR